MKPHTKYFLSIIIAFLIWLSATHVSANEGGAKDFINDNANRVLQILNSSSSPKGALSNLFLEVVDTGWMGKFVLGKYWNTLNEEQRQQFQETYTNYLLSLYVPKYTAYNKNKYTIFATNELQNQIYIVSMHISMPQSNSTVKVEYRVKDLGGNNYKIRDIIAEDVSLISTQRADFSSFLSNKSVEELIADLKAKQKI